MPLERFANVLKLMEMLSCGLSGSEMNSILENMERAISAGLSNPKNAGIVSTYVNVIRERQDMVVHRDLLLNIAATFILRDDEKPEIINPDIHKEKLEAFEQMSKEAPHDFFFTCGYRAADALANYVSTRIQGAVGVQHGSNTGIEKGINPIGYSPRFRASQAQERLSKQVMALSKGDVNEYLTIMSSSIDVFLLKFEQFVKDNKNG